MSSRSLDDLNQYTRDAAIKHKQLCKSRGVELLIYCTKRDNAEQDALYAISRTVPGKRVTNARAGQSAHNPDAYGKAAAYDCCPMIAGKPIWDGKHPAWAIVIQCGEEAGLSASARWAGALKEQAHFQDPNWRKP